MTIEELQLKCKRCGHTWMKRQKEDPAQCPNCKSAYWNKERQREVKQE